MFTPFIFAKLTVSLPFFFLCTRSMKLKLVEFLFDCVCVCKRDNLCLIFHNAKMTGEKKTSISFVSFSFLFSWTQSVHTADSLYSCDWQGKSNDENYDRQRVKATRFDFPCDVDVMKSIKFTIKRAQKPLILMAMKFSALALSTFTRVSLSELLSLFQ